MVVFDRVCVVVGQGRAGLGNQSQVEIVLRQDKEKSWSWIDRSKRTEKLKEDEYYNDRLVRMGL